MAKKNGNDDKPRRWLVAPELHANRSQCYVRLPFADMRGQRWRLRDGLGDAQYDRDGGDMESGGLYLDMGPGAIIFSDWKSRPEPP